MQKGFVYYQIVSKNELPNGTEHEQAVFLLNNMLSLQNEILPEISFSERGKPYFKNGSLYFNYSHTKNFIACAISANEVGIDIEETSRRINDTVANKYLDGEKNHLKKIEIWVRKEAYSKMKGLGFSIGFQNVKLAEIIQDNLTIKNSQYICSIYVDLKKGVFQDFSIS